MVTNKRFGPNFVAREPSVGTTSDQPWLPNDVKFDTP